MTFYENTVSSKPGDFLVFMYFIQHCYICRPSDSTVSEDAGIEPRTVVTLALAVRHSNPSARSHSLPRLDLILSRLDFILTRLDLILTRLHIILTRLDLVLNRLDLILTRLVSARSHPPGEISS